MQTSVLLAELELSDANRELAVPLLERLRDASLLHDAVVGPCEWDGVGIQWPKFGLFCDVIDARIVISVVPSEAVSYRDVSVEAFSASELSHVCHRIARITRKLK